MISGRKTSKNFKIKSSKKSKKSINRFLPKSDN